MLKCLCGNSIVLSEKETITEDVIYKGGSDEVIGKTFSIETICNKCTRQLNIELTIVDKNWD